MRVTITGPRRLSYEDRAVTARAALAFMARRYGFHKARKDWAAPAPGDRG